MNSTEKNVVWVLAGLAGAGVLWFGLLKPRPPVVVRPVVNPAPLCPGPDCPRPPKKPDRRPWAASPAAGLVAPVSDDARVTIIETRNWNGRTYEKRERPGTVGEVRRSLNCRAWATADVGEPEPMVDLLAVPGRKHNISAKGAGCCTFRTIDYSARHQNVPALHDLPEYLKNAGFAGGGYPQKEADMIRRCAAARNVPCPEFIQYEGSDPWFIEAMLASGRSVGITWQANHMLSCVHLDAQQGAIVDNNQPDRVQWFPRQTFLSKWTAGSGGWAIALLHSPPPPVPSNLRPAAQALPCERKHCDCGCKDGEPCRCAAGVLALPRCGCSPLCVCGCNEGGECRCGNEWAEEGGLEWVYGGRERYTFGADMRDMTRQEVEAWLAADAAKLHLTLVGGAPARKAALDLIGAEADRYLVQSYSADDWALQCGFKDGPLMFEGGRNMDYVTTYLQDRAGRVLLRRYDSSTSGLIEKLRRADPTYQPAADPNGDPLSGLSLDQARQWASDNPLTALGGAGAAALAALYLRSKRGQPTGGTPAAATRPATQDDVAALLRDLRDRLPPRAA